MLLYSAVNCAARRSIDMPEDISSLPQDSCAIRAGCQFRHTLCLHFSAVHGARVARCAIGDADTCCRGRLAKLQESYRLLWACAAVLMSDPDACCHRHLPEL